MAMISPELFHYMRRAKELSCARRYLLGTQSEGKPDYWTGKNANGEEVPVRERAPCINYRFARAAVEEIIKFTIGEGRFPRIKVESDRDFLPGVALSADEAQTLSAFISNLIEYAHIKPIWGEALENGLGVGTAVEIVSIRDGEFHSETANAEHCSPTFDSRGSVIAMTQCYQTDVESERDGMIVIERMWYRRDIDTIVDRIYRLTPVLAYGNKVEWSVETETLHGLGFCPVNWGRNRRRVGSAEIDGISIFDGDEAEIDALNMALSHRHRGIHFWGAPQPWETGIEDDENVRATGRTAKPQSNDPYSRSKEMYASKKAGQTGTDRVWRSRSADAKFGLLETSGTAFEATTKHVNDIRGRLAEEIGVVLPDLSVIVGKGDISARLLEMLYAPMLGAVDKVREQWWPQFFLRSIAMRLRMVAMVGALIPGATAAIPIIRKFMVADRWIDPPMTPIWGPYFSPSSAETQAAVNAVKPALEAGLISKKTALEFIAVDFGVRDVEEELAAADSEKKETQAAAMAIAQGPTTPPQDDEAPDTSVKP